MSVTPSSASMPSPVAAPASPAPLPSWLTPTILTAAVIAQVVFALHILGSAPIFGDDHSSHLGAIRHLIALLGHGETNLYCPTYNLGFPMYLYYQPLPHLVVALLHIVSFGAITPQLALNIVVVLLWALYPLAVYRGISRLDVDPLAALLAALAAPLVSSSLTFGFTIHSVMALGLYTQTWAMVLFPLALGAGWRALRDDAIWRHVVGGAGGLLLLSLSHAFYGMVLGTALLIAVLARPRPTRLLRGRFLRLAGLGLITLASLLYWLIPLLQTRAFAGGWPWGGADRWQGYGIAHVAEVLFTGRLFDQGQLPALTLGLALGIVITIRRWREAGAARMIILSFSFSLLFLIGRRTLGHLVDIQPMNLGLQLFRYIGAVHFFGVALAGIGLAALARFTRHHLGGLAALTLLVALLASPEIAQGIRAHGLFRTISAYDKATARELRAIGAAIDRDADTQDKHQGKHQAQGRVYAHNKVGTGTHFIAALLAANTHQPLGQSYGVGMHDSLGFYYLEYLSPSSRKLLDLYGFRWMLVERGGTFDTRERKAGHAPIATSRKLAVYRRTRRPGLFSVGEASFVLVGDPRPLRPAIQMWLRSRLPAQHRFGIIIPASSAKGHASDIDLRRLAWLHRVGDTSAITRSGPGGRGPWKTTRLPWRNLPGSATGATGAIGTTSTISTTSPPGHLLPEPYAPRGARDPGVASSTHLGLRYNARVAMTRPGLVVLAVSAHPFWHAEVDGHPVTSLHVTPAFVAVRVPRGVHTVRFAFENPTYQKILVLITLAAWMLLLIALGVTGPKSKHTHQDRRDP